MLGQRKNVVMFLYGNERSFLILGLMIHTDIYYNIIKVPYAEK